MNKNNFNIFHIPHLLKDGIRYKKIFIEEKITLTQGLPEYELENMRLIEMIKNNLVVHFTIWDKDIRVTTRQCDKYYHKHASAHATCRLLNDFIRAAKFTTLMTSEKDAKDTWRTWVLDGFLERSYPYSIAKLEELKKVNAVYCRLRKKLLIEKGYPVVQDQGECDSNDHRILHFIQECHPSFKERLQDVAKCLGSGFYQLRKGGVLAIVPMTNIWNTKDTVSTIFKNVNNESIAGVLYGIKKHIAPEAEQFLIAAVSTVPPYSTYIIDINPREVEAIGSKEYQAAIEVYNKL